MMRNEDDNADDEGDDDDEHNNAGVFFIFLYCELTSYCLCSPSLSTIWRFYIHAVWLQTAIMICSARRDDVGVLLVFWFILLVGGFNWQHSASRRNGGIAGSP